MTCSDRLGRDILCCRLSRRLANERLFAGQTCSAGRGSGVANDGSSDKRTSTRWSDGLLVRNFGVTLLLLYTIANRISNHCRWNMVQNINHLFPRKFYQGEWTEVIGV